MAGVHGNHVAENIRHRQASFADAAVKILLVSLKRLSLVEFDHIGIGPRVFIPSLIDGGASDLLSIHKNSPLRAFKQNAIIPTTGDNHFNTAWECAVHSEVVRRVVAIVDGGVAILVWHGMLHIGAIDRDRPLALGIFAEGPLGDVDVVRAPVGKLAA